MVSESFSCFDIVFDLDDRYTRYKRSESGKDLTQHSANIERLKLLNKSLTFEKKNDIDICSNILFFGLILNPVKNYFDIRSSVSAWGLIFKTGAFFSVGQTDKQTYTLTN